MKHPSAASAAGRDDPARRAAGRRRRARDGHDQQPVAAVNVLDMDAVEAEQQSQREHGQRQSARQRTPK
jgi:hypothetical protein